MKQKAESISPLIPVINFESCGLLTDCVDKENMESVGLNIKEAFSAVGVCYLKNHGVEKNMVDTFMNISQKYFEQPSEIKEKQRWGDFGNMGWMGIEREKIHPQRPGGAREAFYYIPADDHSEWSMAEFQQINKDMFDVCKKLSHRVCDVLSVGLGLEENVIQNAHQYIGQERNTTSLKSIYYPPLARDFIPKPGQIRMGEHTDHNSFTLLFQDDMGGLEYEIPGQGFIPATPIPDTIIVNMGNVMQRWSSDSLIAGNHRVMIPEEEMVKRQRRQSFGFFIQPDNDFIIKCLDGSDKYEPISGIDYLNKRFGTTVNGSKY